MSNNNLPTHGIDLEALDLGPMVRHARTATFAPNWKSVLATDALVGIVILVLGLAARYWLSLIGWLLVGAGIVYLFMVMRRSLQWRWLRQRAGLR
jgi:hypothetical protein